MKEALGGGAVSLSLSLSLSLKRLRGGGFEGSSFTRNLGRYVKKVSGCQHLSPWGPFPTEGNLVCAGGSYTGDFDGLRELLGGLLSGDVEGHGDEASLSLSLKIP